MPSPAATELEAATVRQIRERLVSAGIATDTEIDEHLAIGQMDVAIAPLISACARKPE